MKIEFNHLENAQDSLNRAFELIVWGNQQQEAQRLKQAVQAVAHAIELLLKERLRKFHPSLIWENVDQYPNLNARTVGAERAAERLKSIGAIEFHSDDLQLLRALRATRNAIEHFAWSTTKPEADAILGKALEFAFYFALNELSIDYLDYSFHKDGTYQELLASNPEFGRAVEKRKKTPIQPILLNFLFVQHAERVRLIRLHTHVDCVGIGSPCAILLKTIIPFNDMLLRVVLTTAEMRRRINGYVVVFITNENFPPSTASSGPKHLA